MQPVKCWKQSDPEMNLRRSFNANLMAAWLFGMLCLPLWAGVVGTDEFSSEVMRLRYLDLIEELRCPKCQNQNLAGSNSAIAIDLRAEVRRLLEEGRSDMEITDFLVARYGDFVRYRPPLKSTTWFLWGAPGLLVLMAMLALWLTKRQRRLEPTASSTLTVEERQHLDQLLNEPVVDSELIDKASGENR